MVDYESVAEDNLTKFLALMPMLPDRPVRVGFWWDGGELLTRNESHAEAMADFIDSLCGMKMAHTGYYDPREDEISNEVDDHTGYYYVDFD